MISRYDSIRRFRFNFFPRFFYFEQRFAKRTEIRAQTNEKRNRGKKKRMSYWIESAFDALRKQNKHLRARKPVVGDICRGNVTRANVLREKRALFELHARATRHRIAKNVCLPAKYPWPKISGFQDAIVAC